MGMPPNRKGDAVNEIKKINLEESVSREEYIACITLLEAFLNSEMKNRHGWCGQRHRYFLAVMPEYSYGRGADGNLDFSKIQEDADYAQLLKDIRGRILWYVNDDVITLEDANDIFDACGLLIYGKREEYNRVQVNLPPLELNVRAENQSEAIIWAGDKILEFIVRMMDGKPVVAGDNYVIASAVFGQGAPNVRPVRSGMHVDTQDTIRPSGHY